MLFSFLTFSAELLSGPYNLFMGRGRGDADEIFYGEDVFLAEESLSFVSSLEEDKESFALAEEIFERIYVDSERLGLLKHSVNEGDIRLSREEPFFITSLSNISPSGEFLSVLLVADADEKPQLELCVYREAEDEFSFDQHHKTLCTGKSLHDIIKAGRKWSSENGCVFDGTRESVHTYLEELTEDFGWIISRG